MKTKIQDYGLRFYVRDLYLVNAGNRGGEVLQSLNKKQKKSITLASFDKIETKFPFSQN
jgi:hypothetical protein